MKETLVGKDGLIPTPEHDPAETGVPLRDVEITPPEPGRVTVSYRDEMPRPPAGEQRAHDPDPGDNPPVDFQSMPIVMDGQGFGKGDTRGVIACPVCGKWQGRPWPLTTVDRCVVCDSLLVIA